MNDISQQSKNIFLYGNTYIYYKIQNIEKIYFFGEFLLFYNSILLS